MFPWDRERDFHRVCTVLEAAGLLQIHASGVSLGNSVALDDLLSAVFAAWAYKALGRLRFEVRFVRLDDHHSLLVVRWDQHPSVLPVATDGPLYCDDFRLPGGTIEGIRARLSYNADISSHRSRLDLQRLASPSSWDQLRAVVAADTVADPDTFGWLFGGQAALVRAPARVVAELMIGEESPYRLLTRRFEQLLCLRLAAESGAVAGRCHLEQQQPAPFSEIDLLLYYPSDESRRRGLWKPASSRSLSADVADDLVFVLENSSGLGGFEGSYTDDEPLAPPVVSAAPGESALALQRHLTRCFDLVQDLRAEQAGEPRSEPEHRWHRKLINHLALRQIGFRRVRLHLCSLYPVSINNAAFEAVLAGAEDISRFDLGPEFAEEVRTNRATLASVRGVCQRYVDAALQSIRELQNVAA